MVGLRLAPPRRQCDVDYQPTGLPAPFDRAAEIVLDAALHEQRAETGAVGRHDRAIAAAFGPGQAEPAIAAALGLLRPVRSEEHTSELQSLMRISYAVFCLKKKNKQNNTQQKYIILKTNQYTTITK